MIYVVLILVDFAAANRQVVKPNLVSDTLINAHTRYDGYIIGTLIALIEESILIERMK